MRTGEAGETRGFQAYQACCLQEGPCNGVDHAGFRSMSHHSSTAQGSCWKGGGRCTLVQVLLEGKRGA